MGFGFVNDRGCMRVARNRRIPKQNGYGRYTAALQRGTAKYNWALLLLYVFGRRTAVFFQTIFVWTLPPTRTDVNMDIGYVNARLPVAGTAHGHTAMGTQYALKRRSYLGRPCLVRRSPATTTFHLLFDRFKSDVTRRLSCTR